MFSYVIFFRNMIFNVYLIFQHHCINLTKSIICSNLPKGTQPYLGSHTGPFLKGSSFPILPSHTLTAVAATSSPLSPRLCTCNSLHCQCSFCLHPPEVSAQVQHLPGINCLCHQSSPAWVCALSVSRLPGPLLSLLSAGLSENQRSNNLFEDQLRNSSIQMGESQESTSGASQ